MNGDTSGPEYFLLENKQFNGFDNSLPGTGLLIWHVDESVDGNWNEWHPKIGLVQADGLQQLEHKNSYGDWGDPFPGTSSNSTFTATSTPNSKAYSGADTFVSVTNVPESSSSMSFDITVKAVTPSGDFDPRKWYRLTNTFAG